MIMFQLFDHSYFKFTHLFLLAGLIGISIGSANEDMEQGQKSKEMVEEMKRKEGELREETNKKIHQTRELGLNHLEKLMEQYLSQNKNTEAESIAKEINVLRDKLGMPPLEKLEKPVAKDDVKSGNDKENQHFIYNTNYRFNEDGFIKGTFTFMQNQKVRINYNHKGKEVSEFPDWKDMGDHVQINANNLMGQILISTSPSSNKKSLIVRWGGELANKLSDAKAQ